jgi:predicted PhzF superfamily epimerase YddE/YHI9
VRQLRLRTVDAFADRPFSGNPAAVLVLDEMPPDGWMRAIAGELNLSETAFVVSEELPDADFRLRWFTPAVEVELCGHATLAAAHCLLDDGFAPPIRFATRSGVLTIARAADASLAMDFPARPAVPIAEPPGLVTALGAFPEWVGRGGTDDLLVLLADEATLRELTPDIGALAEVPARGVIVTAAAEPGADHDFVSRFFAPNVGVPEDPVTGSTHTVLAPFWAERLGQPRLVGLQASARSGLVGVELRGDRVLLSGRAVTILDGTLTRSAGW